MVPIGARRTKGSVFWGLAALGVALTPVHTMSNELPSPKLPVANAVVVVSKAPSFVFRCRAPEGSRAPGHYAALDSPVHDTQDTKDMT